MDIDFENFYLFDYLKEFSMYIFVCVIFGFGSMIYYFSIKAPNPAFDSPKLVKKKTKKEKQIRSKITKIVSEKNELKVPINYVSEINHEPIVSTYTVDEDDSSWLPATKPKKNLKQVKPISKSQKELPKESDSKISVATMQKPLESIVPPKKPTVIEPVCDNAIPELQKTYEKPSISKVIVPVPPSPVEEVLTESPTNSCSDDFELVEIGKTSSEDTSTTAPISSTSGASRKKNKKQQKLISKQLIEAASLVTERNCPEAPVEPVKMMPAVSSKKKRPRKED